MLRLLALLMLAYRPCSGFGLMAMPPGNGRACRAGMAGHASWACRPIMAETEPERDAIKYFRDPDDAYFEKQQGLPPVDEALVDQLVAERAVMRACRDYESADLVKAKVLEMGVTIVDMRGREAWYVTKRHSRYIGLDEPEPEPPSKPQREFGPRGHDYERVGGGAKGKAGQTSLGAIDEMLAARLMAKLKGNFKRADGKRAELAALGVAICDETKQWRADGLSFGEGKGVECLYERVPGDGDAETTGLDVAPIVSLLVSRTAAKRRRDFVTADAAAEALRTEHSVIVDDKRKTWRVVKLYGGLYRVGSKVGQAEPKIGRLLTRRSERLESHGEGDEEAIRLGEELKLMGVQVDDHRGTWKRPKRSQEEMALVREEMRAREEMASVRGEKLPTATAAAGSNEVQVAPPPEPQPKPEPKPEPPTKAAADVAAEAAPEATEVVEVTTEVTAEVEEAAEAAAVVPEAETSVAGSGEEPKPAAPAGFEWGQVF